MQYERLELPAGDDQLIVVFVNQDSAQMLDPSGFAQALADDATARRLQGWRLVAVSSLPMRQMGTAGNVLFQSGGQYATQAGMIAVYAAEPPPDSDAPRRQPALATDPNVQAPGTLTT